MRRPPPPPPGRACEWFRTSYNKIKIRQPYFFFFFFYRDSALIVIVWDQALCEGSTIWLLREDMGDLLRGENDSKWSSEVQAIGDRIFFTDIQWCKNFSSIIPYKTYFFSEQEVFSLGISLQDFFLSKSVWDPGRVQNPRKFCLWNSENNKVLLWKAESWALEPGIQLKESGIHPWLESRTKVPLSRNPKCSTWNLETMAWNPETKTVARN